MVNSRRDVLGYRIAVASKDGKVVTDHFGHCGKFIIIEVDNENYRFIEQRLVTPPCRGGIHTKSGIEEVLTTIEDCMYILVYQIGQGAEKIALKNNFIVITYKGFVTDALDQIMSAHP